MLKNKILGLIQHSANTSKIVIVYLCVTHQTLCIFQHLFENKNSLKLFDTEY